MAMSPGPHHHGLCLPSDLVGFLGREHTGGTVMVSEAQVPLGPDLGGNGQWDVGVGIRNSDKGSAVSPAADAVPRVQASPVDRAPTVSSGYF